MYQWCGFKSCRGKNKNLTALKSNSNTVWFNFQTYIYIHIIYIYIYILCCIEFVIIGRRHCTFLAHLVNIHDILHSRIGVYITRWITCGFCLYFFLQLFLVKLQRRRQVTTKMYKQRHLTFYSCHISLDKINDVLWFLPFNNLRYDSQQCICFCFVLQTVYDVLHTNITKAGSIKFT